jgi:Uma2 family endonuclease
MLRRENNHTRGLATFVDPTDDSRMTTPTVPILDWKKLKQVYEEAERRYLESLPPEHFMEAVPHARQREITLESFAVIHALRPEIQCFNELLVQYPRPGHDPYDPGQVVPDNFVVISPEPIFARGSYMTPLQPVPPFLVLEYVSASSKQKDYRDNFCKYERELCVPYYLHFDLDQISIHLYRWTPQGYEALPPNEQGRHVIPELEIEVALVGDWMRFWFRGELVPLPAELLSSLESERQARRHAQELVRAARHQAEVAKFHAEQAQKQAEIAQQQAEQLRQQVEAERQARLALEAELARLREQLGQQPPAQPPNTDKTKT